MRPEDLRSDLDPALDETEIAALMSLGERLRTERPIPPPAFRGRLGRLLASRSALPPRPVRLWRWVAASAAGGTSLLAVALASVLGAGPLAS